MVFTHRPIITYCNLETIFILNFRSIYNLQIHRKKEIPRTNFEYMYMSIKNRFQQKKISQSI